jgi:predicted lipoprotein with Yx(FWY)xxD motif
MTFKLPLAILGVAATIGVGTATAAVPIVTAHDSRYGSIVFDGRGYVLYAFTRDNGRSTCTGACAAAWPPYIVKSRPRGARLGAVRRKDGKLQVTYAGRPVYHYVGDRRPGQILCQDVVEYGGRWLVIRPSGALVR